MYERVRDCVCVSVRVHVCIGVCVNSIYGCMVCIFEKVLTYDTYKFMHICIRMDREKERGRERERDVHTDKHTQISYTDMHAQKIKYMHTQTHTCTMETLRSKSFTNACGE